MVKILGATVKNSEDLAPGVCAPLVIPITLEPFLSWIYFRPHAKEKR
jgi:hypothetical protein